MTSRAHPAPSLSPPARAGEDVDRAEPGIFFAAARDAFMAATDVAGSFECDYRIGELGVRLRFAGPALVPLLTPALAHLEVPPGAVVVPALTVLLWDSASVGVPMPPPAWGADGYRPRGEIRGFDGPVRAAYQEDLGALSLFDVAAGEAIFWTRDARLLRPYETAAPLRAILHWAMGGRGRRFVHGAAVGTATGGVLIVGRGGVGKSTTSLACLAAPESGLRFAGDDYVLLEEGEAPRVHSLYASAKLRADHLWRLPRLAPLAAAADGVDEGKLVLLLHRRCPERLGGPFPIRAILLPRVVGGPATRLRPVGGGAALAALAPSTIFQLAGAGADTLRALSRLAAQVPCYVLELGDDTGQIPGVVASLLAAGGAG